MKDGWRELYTGPDDAPTCSRCHRPVSETADCHLSRGRPVYLPVED